MIKLIAADGHQINSEWAIQFAFQCQVCKNLYCRDILDENIAEQIIISFETNLIPKNIEPIVRCSYCTTGVDLNYN